MISSNIEQIDHLAEFCGFMFASRVVNDQYRCQYGNEKDNSGKFIERNLYLDVCKQKKLEYERLASMMGVNIATQLAVKGGSGIALKWLSDMDKYKTCEQMYSLLVSYINGAQEGANRNKACIELNKIRNSFPIKSSQKKKLAEKYVVGVHSDNILDVSSVVAESNKDVRNALAYFLTVLQKQLYGMDYSDQKKLLDFYSLLDINGGMGRELLNENNFKYINIASDQVAYLKLSRAVVKELSTDIPSIDLKKVIEHAQMMAQYDPYADRRKKIKGIYEGGKVTILGLISKQPDLAANGIATAMAQFLPNDEFLSRAKEKMTAWGISVNEFDKLIQHSNAITEQTKQNDMYIEQNKSISERLKKT